MGTGQQQEDAVVTIRLLAKGIVEIARRITDGAIVRQDDMPNSLRSGLERLSRHCLEEGMADHGANVHVLMDLATIPIGEWGVPCFSGEFPYVQAVLIDRDLGIPSGDCFEIGSISTAEDAYEDSDRGTKSKPIPGPHLVYGFLTTAPSGSPCLL
jgi:hypothetical protein